MSLADWFRDAFQPSPPVITGVISAGAEILRQKPKPKLTVVTPAPSREEFAAWRSEPITGFAFAALRAAHRAQKEQWDEASWNGGLAEQETLIMLRTRADAYAALEEADYEAFCQWAGVEPEKEAKDAE